MSNSHDSLAAAFERAADAAKVAETGYRRAAMTEIARLETERVTAFRRVRLVRMLEDAARGASNPDDATAHQRARLCKEFGWSGEAAGERVVLEQLKPVCAALYAMPVDEASSVILPRLRDFEAWFQSDRGVSFYALFDQYVQETPVVDF